MTLGNTIQTKRIQQGLSQERLAEQVGVSRQAVSKWEVGDAIPDTDKLVPLARALGITVDELLGNSPEEPERSEEKKEPVVIVKQPGWFATHWYYLGLIPVAWGVWQLLWLLVMVLSVAGMVGMDAPVFGNFEITTSAGAFPIG